MTENRDFHKRYNIFTGIGTVNHNNTHPFTKYYHANLNKLLYVYVIFTILKFLTQNCMLMNWRDRVRYNVLFVKFSSKIRK